MKDIEKDYELVRREIAAKINEVSRLLKEANKLVKKANVKGEFDNCDITYNKAKYINDFYGLDPEDDEKDIEGIELISKSPDKFYDVLDESGWRTSSFNC